MYPTIDSTRWTCSVRLSSLPCVLRPRRPHAHCFYCTRARLPLALPDYLSTSSASPFPSSHPWTRFALVHEVPPVLLHSCAIRSSRCAGTHVVARRLDLAPLSLRMRSPLYASCPPPPPPRIALDLNPDLVLGTSRFSRARVPAARALSLLLSFRTGLSFVARVCSIRSECSFVPVLGFL
ncbi:hypothetical protein B0H13DRAFT_2353960 [Mycena leptocephala]|nr:hypothetical protein B0H13DRAFT_2353960 [Mycena leptocephala]